MRVEATRRVSWPRGERERPLSCAEDMIGLVWTINGQVSKNVFVRPRGGNISMIYIEHE